MLVDTNVLFSLVVETDLSAMALRLFEADAEWHSESYVLVELGNVLVRYARNRRMSVDDAHLALERAEMLIGRRLYAVHHPDALDTALRHGVSAYDARFLVAAKFLNKRLVTEDLKLRRAAPSLTCSLEEAMR